MWKGKGKEWFLHKPEGKMNARDDVKSRSERQVDRGVCRINITVLF